MKMDLKCNSLTGVAVLQHEMTGPNALTEEEVKIEQNFIQDFTCVLADVFENVGDPFHLHIYEIKNSAIVPTWDLKVANQGYDERLALFQSGISKHLFMTCLSQQYMAFCPPKHCEDYAGKVGIELTMFGHQNEHQSWVIDSRAEAYAHLAFIQYQYKIMRFYPQWETLYINAPTINSQPVTRLEE